jgi:hypothetical protein
MTRTTHTNLNQLIGQELTNLTQQHESERREAFINGEAARPQVGSTPDRNTPEARMEMSWFITSTQIGDNITVGLNDAVVGDARLSERDV